jgi:hypothetical protein
MRKIWIMVVLAALVAAAAVIVYGHRGERPAEIAAATATGVTPQEAPPATAGTDVPKSAPPASAPEPLPPASAEPLPPAAPQATLQPAPAGSGVPNVHYDVTELPDPAHRMFEEIIVAAQSGDIVQLKPVLEMNELKPMVATAAVDDPIAFWKKASADGQGREVMAALLNILNAGFAKVKDGKEETYVWPYFAEADLAKLSPTQIIELYRVVPAAQAVAMQKSGKYTYYRLGISANGVWHYFLQ